LAIRRRKNLVQARSFAEMLEQTLRPLAEPRHRGGASDRRTDRAGEGHARGERARLGDQTLRAIARALVETVRNNVTIDWTVRENVRAHLRVLVKRILRKHGYPPDKQEKATQTVLEQAELLSEGWAAA
jgi:type I restriction enzyme R subunit